MQQFCRVENFSALYMIRKTKEGGPFFVERSSSDKLIVNLMDSDHEWHNTVIRIHGAWETVIQKDRGAILTMWNKGTLMHKELPVTEEAEETVRACFKLKSTTAVGASC